MKFTKSQSKFTVNLTICTHRLKRLKSGPCNSVQETVMFSFAVVFCNQFRGEKTHLPVIYHSETEITFLTNNPQDGSPG